MERTLRRGGEGGGVGGIQWFPEVSKALYDGSTAWPIESVECVVIRSTDV